MEKFLVPPKEKFLVPPHSGSDKPRSIIRNRWKRDLIELSGRFDPSYRHFCSKLIVQSYSEVALFPHCYYDDYGDDDEREPCHTHMTWFTNSQYNNSTPIDHTQIGRSPIGQIYRRGISSLEFDSKGVYLASVTKSGCLTVHDFDSIQSDLKDEESRRLVHIPSSVQLDVVRWNHANQDEVACTSTKSSEICIYDIGLVSSEPVAVLKGRHRLNVHGCYTYDGFCDIAFCSGDDSRLLASDTGGFVNIWDRRASDLPCLVLRSSTGSLNSIKLSGDNEIVYGASRQGTIYMWDLRGGRSSGAFGNQKEGYFPPLTAVKLARELEKISSLKAQANIVPKEIHSIDFDPSCPYQLAFHLDDGWSGVLDINKLHVTHIHCPPPSWLDEDEHNALALADISHLRKPCWLPMNSIYVVGSSSSEGIYFLDLYPDHTSACHVDYNEDIQKPDTTKRLTQNRLLKVSEDVTACAAHPLNGTIVAGTKPGSLILVSQKKGSC